MRPKKRTQYNPIDTCIYTYIKLLTVRRDAERVFSSTHIAHCNKQLFAVFFITVFNLQGVKR